MGGCPSVDSVREGGPERNTHNGAQAARGPVRTLATQGASARPETPDGAQRAPPPPRIPRDVPSTPPLGMLPLRRPLMIHAPSTPDFVNGSGQVSARDRNSRLQQPHPDVLLLDPTAATNPTRYLELERQRLSIPQTPTSSQAGTYQYFCPICMLHFREIYKSHCCGNSICVVCALSHVKQRATGPDALLVDTWLSLPTDRSVEGVGCPLCNQDQVRFAPVHPSEKTRSYIESPHTKGLVAAMEARRLALERGPSMVARVASSRGIGAPRPQSSVTLRRPHGHPSAADPTAAAPASGGAPGVTSTRPHSTPGHDAAHESDDDSSCSGRISGFQHQVYELRNEPLLPLIQGLLPGEQQDDPADIEHDEDQVPVPAAAQQRPATAATGAADDMQAMGALSLSALPSDADFRVLTPYQSVSLPAGLEPCISPTTAAAAAASSADAIVTPAAQPAMSVPSSPPPPLLRDESKRPDTAPPPAQADSDGNGGESGPLLTSTGSVSARRIQLQTTPTELLPVTSCSSGVDPHPARLCSADRRAAAAQVWTAESIDEERKEAEAGGGSSGGDTGGGGGVRDVSRHASPALESSPHTTRADSAAGSAPIYDHSSSLEQEALFLPSPQARQLRKAAVLEDSAGVTTAASSSSSATPISADAAASASASVAPSAADAPAAPLPLSRPSPPRPSSPSMSVAVSSPFGGRHSIDGGAPGMALRAPSISQALELPESSASPTAVATAQGLRSANTASAATGQHRLSLNEGGLMMEESFSFDASASFMDALHPAAVHPMPLQPAPSTSLAQAQ